MTKAVLGLAPLGWPSVVAVLARRMSHRLRRLRTNSFFGTPCAWMNGLLWMVSCDTRIVPSLACSALSHPDTCWGDHWACSFSATKAWSGLLIANK